MTETHGQVYNTVGLNEWREGEYFSTISCSTVITALQQEDSSEKSQHSLQLLEKNKLTSDFCVPEQTLTSETFLFPLPSSSTPTCFRQLQPGLWCLIWIRFSPAAHWVTFESEVFSAWPLFSPINRCVAEAQTSCRRLARLHKQHVHLNPSRMRMQKLGTVWNVECELHICRIMMYKLVL